MNFKVQISNPKSSSTESESLLLISLNYSCWNYNMCLLEKMYKFGNLKQKPSNENLFY